MPGQRKALLIATDSYSDATFRELRAPRTDADALAAVLAEDAIGGYEVRPVVHNAAAHEVTVAIEDFLAESHRDDHVLLYISGHGVKDDAGMLYLPTTNSRHNRLASTAVSAQFVRHRMDESRSRRIVVLLDCCFAGAFPSGSGHRAGEGIDVLAQLGGRGCAVMTSSSALEYSYEAVDDAAGTVSGRARPSVFTGVVLEGLRTGRADLDGDGLIDIEELYDYVLSEIRKVTSQQTPTLDSRIEGDKLYVARSTRGRQPDTRLPHGIREAVTNPISAVRLAAVQALAVVAESGSSDEPDPVLALLARLAQDDDPSVAEAAQAAMRQHGQPATAPAPDAAFVALAARPSRRLGDDGVPAGSPLRGRGLRSLMGVRPRRRRGVVAHGSGLLDRAAGWLATAVAAQWTVEAEVRSLLRPEPLRVRWSGTGRPVAAPPSAVLGDRVPGRPLRIRLYGEINEVVDKFRKVPSRQLVVLGAPGAGKTVLVMMLTLGLLGDLLQPGEPVPVLLAVSSWNPREEHLHRWITRTLRSEYPSLDNTEVYGPDAAARLVAEGHVMPVLDGLDEMPEALQQDAIKAINQAVADQRPLVVTCRSVEYESAVVEGGFPLSRAAVVELEPATVVDVIAYLDAADGDEDRRWTPVFDHLRTHPDGALARALSTPLMAYLARTAYTDPTTDPTELLDTDTFTDHTAIESGLLGSFLPAVYSPHRRASTSPGAPRYRPEQVQRWLSFLVEHLDRLQTEDLQWWHLARAVPRWIITTLVALAVTIIGVAPAVVVFLATRVPPVGTVLIALGGLAVAIVVGVRVGRTAHAPPRPVRRTSALAALGGAVGDIAAALPAVSVISAVVLLITYVLAQPAAIDLSFATADLVGGRYSSGVLLAVLALVSVPVLWFVVFTNLLGAGRAGVPQRSIPRLRRLVPSRTLGIVLGLVGGVPGVAVGIFAHSLGGGLITGLVLVGLVGVPVSVGRWLNTPIEQQTATSPQSVLRSDRTALLITTAACGIAVAFVVLLAGVTSEILGSSSLSDLPNILIYSVVLGLVVAVTVMLGSGTAWLSYTVARLWLALWGRLPWRLMGFLRDAHHRGVLRQAGPTYRLRHDLLKTHLAQKRSPEDRHGLARALIKTSAQHDRRPQSARLSPWRYLVTLITAAAMLIAMTAFIYLPHLPCTTFNTPPAAVAFSPDWHTLAATDENGVRLWNVRTGQPLHDLDPPNFLGRAVAFSPDGNTLAAAAADGGVRLWDAGTGRLLHDLGTSAYGLAVVFSPDGNTLAATDENGVRLWNVRTGQPVHDLDFPNFYGFAVAFSPDGNILAATGDDGVRLWNTRTGQPIDDFDIPNFLGRAVAFSPDGNVLAAAADAGVRLWNTRTGQPLHQPAVSAGASAVYQMSFSPDGRTLAVGSDDGAFRLWDIPAAPSAAQSDQRCDPHR